jgi:hypothetical protein
MAINTQPQITPGQREYANSVTPPKKAKNKQISTQAHLQFSEIRDGIVVMRDGSLRMVILCSPTNFDLKSPSEKDAVEFAFQGFLNGLHFPIQIVIQSRKIDLDSYLDKLAKIQSDQPNPLLSSLMEDYIFNIRGLLDEVNIMEKRFYTVVPYYVAGVSRENIITKLRSAFKGNADVTQTSTEYENRKRELLQRTNLVAQGLAQIGVRSVVLNTQEVIELFYNSYNIDESQAQSLVDINQINTPAVVRTGGPATPQAPQPKEPTPDDLFTAAQKQAQATQTPPTNQTKVL